MRCFFMKSGRICAVEYLSGESDVELIRQAQDVFTAKGLPMGAEGFEVWDHARFVYRFVLEGAGREYPAQDGLKGAGGLRSASSGHGRGSFRLRPQWQAAEPDRPAS